MTCMKCGREIPAEQVFCDSCLALMEKYPVKPDAAIHLPLRKEATSTKKQSGRRRQLPPEEQILLLRKRNRRLRLTVVILSIVLAAAVAGVVFLQLHPDAPATIPMGRNYTISPTPHS